MLISLESIVGKLWSVYGKVSIGSSFGSLLLGTRRCFCDMVVVGGLCEGSFGIWFGGKSPWDFGVEMFYWELGCWYFLIGIG